MFPDVYLCGGEYGPSHFDIVSAITAWVEHGPAPNKIMVLRIAAIMSSSNSQVYNIKRGNEQYRQSIY